MNDSELTLSEKVQLAAPNGLTRQQIKMMTGALSRLLERKTPEEVTVIELQGLVEIAESILPRALTDLFEEEA